MSASSTISTASANSTPKMVTIVSKVLPPISTTCWPDRSRPAILRLSCRMFLYRYTVPVLSSIYKEANNNNNNNKGHRKDWNEQHRASTYHKLLITIEAQLFGHMVRDAHILRHKHFRPGVGDQVFGCLVVAVVFVFERDHFGRRQRQTKLLLLVVVTVTATVTPSHCNRGNCAWRRNADHPSQLLVCSLCLR